MKKYLTLIAMTVALVACGREELPEPVEEPEAATLTYALTVEATKGADDTSKALSIDDSGAKNVLKSTWTEGDAVSVYNVTTDETLSGTLTAQSSGASTTLKGSLTSTKGIGEGNTLQLEFQSPSYASQNGTLEYIAANCDYAVATVSVTDTSTPSITTSAASFENQQAIVRFTLKNKANDAAISVTPLTVSDGVHTYTVTPSSATGELYVALPGFSGSTVSLTGLSGSDTFLYKKTGISFANGQYYEITVKMTKAEYVDFGLPSGTKWATFNLGATKPEDLGDYFAWGATEPLYSSLSPSLVWKPGKETGYSDGNAPYYSGSDWTKYNGITELQPEDDAAYANWGSAWSMPNQGQWEELFSYCTCEAYSLNGVAGYNVSRNDKEIFIPICGHYSGTTLSSAGSPFYFASTTGYTGSPILYAMYAAPNAKMVYHTGRRLGMSVRPVRSGNRIYSYSFGYTGAVQPFIAPVAGTYTLEVWGAQGGNRTHSDEKLTYGGLGGYATCRTYLSKGETIYVYVGGQGGSVASDAGLAAGTGGWNGGGDGGNGAAGHSGSAGGGGATHISKVNNQVIGSGSGQCASLVGTNFIIVAGGGGGAGHTVCGVGAGGGTEGGKGTRYTSSLTTVEYSPYFYYSTSQSYGARGGHGIDASTTAEGAGGGGGGYYGGTSNFAYETFPEEYQDAGGCGGNSAYNSNYGTNFSTTAGQQWGNGRAIITLYSL